MGDKEEHRSVFCLRRKLSYRQQGRDHRRRRPAHPTSPGQLRLNRERIAIEPVTPFEIGPNRVVGLQRRPFFQR